MIDIGAIIIGILIGAALAVLLIYLYVRGLIREVMAELDEHIERAAAIAGGFRQDVGERVLLRIGVDEFQFVDDPVAAGEDSFAGTHAVLSLRRRRMAGSSSSRFG